MSLVPTPDQRIARAKSRSRQQRGPSMKSKLHLKTYYISPEDRVSRKALIDEYVKKNDVRCVKQSIAPLPEGDHGYGIWGKFS